MSGNNVCIFCNKGNSQINFAVTELKKSLKDKGFTVIIKPVKYIKESIKGENDYRIIMGTIDNDRLIENINKKFKIPDELGEEAYIIRQNSEDKIREYWIIGGKSNGAMYGGIDFAEKIMMEDNIEAIKDSNNSPHIKKRGIKLNIPLDARTPSYSDGGDSAQKNIGVMWNIDYWKEYLDELAKKRYNVLSLWNLHPFPSLIKVEGYEEIALDNVMRADINWEKFNSNFNLTGENMVTDEIKSNLILEKELSIEEKIKFWQEVMKYASNRNIEFYIITWNIFTWGTNGKYGIDNSPDNSISKDYIRKSVRELFNTYPLLAGIGVTAGENMRDLSPAEKEKWLFETYGRGVIDVLQDNPERKIRFIHRHWWSSLKDILSTFKPLIDYENAKFDFSFKYSRAHMYSNTDPVFADEVFDSLPPGKKMWCNLRNDDIYTLRWGDPDYVRKYILNLPSETKTPGFYIGSDGYVFGRESVSINPEEPSQKEISKHWYNFMLWGKLAFNPRENNSFFKKIIKNKFSLDDDLADSIYSAWKNASAIIPLVNRFHWNDWDFQWHVESCCGREGFHTVEDFIKNPTMEGTDLINIKDYCNKKLKEIEINSITPLDVANTLKDKARSSLKILNKISVELNSGNNELNKTINDIKAMSYLGTYYARKIKGAVNLCFYRKTNNKANNKENFYHDKALNFLKEALNYWEDYSNIMNSNYKSPLLARIGKIDWREIREEARLDIEKI